MKKGRFPVLASNINELALTDLASPADPTLQSRFTFPISAATGSAATAAVYFEVAPGKRLGRHTDSSEEIIYVVEGTGEATVGDERVAISTGTLAVVPGDHGTAVGAPEFAAAIVAFLTGR